MRFEMTFKMRLKMSLDNASEKSSKDVFTKSAFINSFKMPLQMH